MNHASAAQAYADRSEYIEAVIDALRVALMDHAARAEAKPRDWGFVGDLGRVAELLDQAVLATVSTNKEPN